MKKIIASKNANGKVTKELIETVAPYNIGVMIMAKYIDELQKSGAAASKIAAELDGFKAKYGSNQCPTSSPN